VCERGRDRTRERERKRERERERAREREQDRERETERERESEVWGASLLRAAGKVSPKVEVEPAEKRV